MVIYFPVSTSNINKIIKKISNFDEEEILNKRLIQVNLKWILQVISWNL